MFEKLQAAIEIELIEAIFLVVPKYIFIMISFHKNLNPFSFLMPSHAANAATMLWTTLGKGVLLAIYTVPASNLFFLVFCCTQNT